MPPDAAWEPEVRRRTREDKNQKAVVPMGKGFHPQGHLLPVQTRAGSSLSLSQPSHGNLTSRSRSFLVKCICLRI